MHMVSTGVRVRWLLVVRKQINRNWANQPPWSPRELELVFSEWKNVSCSSIYPSIHPSIHLWFCLLAVVDSLPRVRVNQHLPAQNPCRMDGWCVDKKHLFIGHPSKSGWEQKQYGQEGKVFVESNTSWGNRSPTKKKTQKLFYFILFLKTTHAN